MTEEIKEILDKLKYIVDFPIIEHDTSFNSDNVEENVCLLISNECQLLLDCITNLQQEIQTYKRLGFKHLTEKNKELQQENERLKEELKNIPIVDFTYDVYKELEDYKSRCEKAIEYVKENYPTSTINY